MGEGGGRDDAQMDDRWGDVAYFVFVKEKKKKGASAPRVPEWG